MEKQALSACVAMPTTAEILTKAAELIKQVLPPEYYGRVILIYEKGKATRTEVQQSFKL